MKCSIANKINKMRAKINYHNGLYACLNYSYRKIEKGEATVLTHSSDIMDTDIKTAYATMLHKTQLHSFKENVIHVSLNFQPGNPITVDKMRQVQDEYIKLMKWENNTFISFTHTDRQHPHIHIVIIRDKNVFLEFKTSMKAVDTLCKKYELIKDLDPIISERVQKISVKNQIKDCLDKMTNIKNIYVIDDVQRIFNAISPTYKMFINKEKESICFVDKLNTSFIKSSDFLNGKNSLLFKAFRILKDKIQETSPEEENISNEELLQFQKIQPNKLIINDLLELQLKKNKFNVEEFTRIFQKNYKDYQFRYNEDQNTIYFVNRDDKKYFEIQNTIHASQLYFKTTFGAWEEKLSNNLIDKQFNDNKENTSFLRKSISNFLESQIASSKISSFDELKEEGSKQGYHFIFYGNINKESGKKQITGWSVFDENAGYLFKMSDINREFSFVRIANLFERRKQQIKPQLEEIKLRDRSKRLPLEYYSPYISENQKSYDNYLKEPLFVNQSFSTNQQKKPSKNIANSLTNNKSNEKNNNDHGFSR
jgi:hypothetical protein